MSNPSVQPSRFDRVKEFLGHAGRIAGQGMQKGMEYGQKGAEMYMGALTNHRNATLAGTAVGAGALGLGAYGMYRALNPSYQPAQTQDVMQQMYNQAERGQGQDEVQYQDVIPQGGVPIYNEEQRKAQMHNYGSLTHQDYEKERFRLLKEQNKLQDQLAFNEIYGNAIR